MPDFKDEISPGAIAGLADAIARAWPPFDRDGFVAAAVAGLEERELLARVEHVAGALAPRLPDDFDAAAGVIDRALESGSLTGWITLALNTYVAARGIERPDVALPLLARLTPHFSSEGAIRPFIERHPDATFAYLERWSRHPDEHVRRLVSEGTRPRLPWAPRLRGLMQDPSPVLPLLDRLAGDDSAYVRRSVANHLNDISKDHPRLAVEVARRWARAGTPEAAWVVRHGLRTLVKAGDGPALELLGFAPDADVRLTAFAVSPESVPVGGSVELSLTLLAPAAPQRVVVDYRVEHAGARGARRPKVFKLATATLEPGVPRTITKRHAFRPVSVRRIHPGAHHVAVQVNGRVLHRATVDVTAAARP